MNFLKPIAFLLICCNITIVTPSRGWWKNTMIYEIYIRSFKDSDGDGIGDLKGITSKLDHFVEIGVETIWITPFFKSPMVDMGYDVANYTEIDPIFGTMQDFDELIRGVKRRGLKLIIELVLNHCSDKHPWFEKSIKRIEPYTDYYVWKDPKGYTADGTPIPPNNWLSIFEGSAWQWNKQRKQFYYHKFEIEQPDFNLTNPAVKEEFLVSFRIKAGFILTRKFVHNPEAVSQKSRVCAAQYSCLYWQVNLGTVFTIPKSWFNRTLREWEMENAMKKCWFCVYGDKKCCKWFSFQLSSQLHISHVSNIDVDNTFADTNIPLTTKTLGQYKQLAQIL